MWERFHVFLAKAGEFPPFDPRPCPDISDGVFPFAVAGQVLAGLARVLAAQLDLENAVDAEGFVAETFDGVCIESIMSICITPRPVGRVVH